MVAGRRHSVYAFMLSVLSSVSTAEAAVIRLFSAPSSFVFGYAQKVREIKAGDVVVFSNDKRFVIASILGRGANSVVFETSDGLALKVPRNATAASQLVLNDFVEGYDNLRTLGGFVVAVEESFSGEYALVTNVTKPSVSLEELLQRPELRTKFGEERVWAELKKFLIATAPFAAIGDFKPEQVLFSEKLGFKLVDWQSYHSIARSIPAQSVLDDRSWRDRLPTLFVKDVQAEIQQVRRSRNLPGEEPPGLLCRILASLRRMRRLGTSSY